MIGSILTYVLLPLPLIAQGLLTLAIMPQSVTKIQLFTIEDMLFGRFELFDVDFMNVDGFSAENDTAYVPSETNVLIKKNIQGWFVAMRNFAIVALFAVLIAIGILMAISTIASDRAKYKNMAAPAKIIRISGVNREMTGNGIWPAAVKQVAIRAIRQPPRYTLLLIRRIRCALYRFFITTPHLLFYLISFF